MRRRALLVCGVLAPVLFIGMNVIAPVRWPEYSVTSQTVSELSAIGAPTRTLWIALGSVYTVLMVAFGWGIWQSAPRQSRLRVLGGLFIAHAVFGMLWPPIHSREVLAAGDATLTDTLHIAWAMVVVLLMLLEFGVGAAAFGTRFRLYSIATAILVFGFGALTTVYAPSVQANLPTPWLGIWQRINITAFTVWVLVLAIALLKVRVTAAASGHQDTLAA